MKLRLPSRKSESNQRTVFALVALFSVAGCTGCQPVEVADSASGSAARVVEPVLDRAIPGSDHQARANESTETGSPTANPAPIMVADQEPTPSDAPPAPLEASVDPDSGAQSPDLKDAGGGIEAAGNETANQDVAPKSAIPQDSAADLIAAGLIDPQWTRMDPLREVWIDREKRQVVLGGRICFREGMLEMFACPRGTKEHESVVAVESSASLAHACLLALDCNPGNPVSWDPDYKEATGPEIGIEVAWKENGETVRRDAREMVLNIKTGEQLSQAWVFGGSRFFTEESTGEEFYCGDGGEFVCLSNFSTATLDLPIKSSDANGLLMFEANPAKIPELETRVLLFLIPPAVEATPASDK
jgi:hypothetical protein